MTITTYDDIIDPRDVKEVFDDLTEERAELVGDALTTWDTENAVYLAELESLLDQLGDDLDDCGPMIRYSYFPTYAAELAEDCGMLENSDKWPCRHIDWNAAADELQMDYRDVQFNGITYWVR